MGIDTFVSEKPVNRDEATAAEDVLDVYRHNRRNLRRFLHTMLPSAAEIDDILQDTFVRVYEAKEKSEIKSPKAYIFKVAHNLALQHIKKSSRLAFGEFDTPVEHPAGEAASEDLAHWRNKYQVFLEAVEGLSPQCRNVFILRKFQGKSHKEIARQLGISTKTVEAHITRAIVESRSYMARRGYMKRKPT